MLGTDPNYVVDYTSQSRRTFGAHDVRAAKPERVRRDANFSNAGLFEGTNGVHQNPRPTANAAVLQAACNDAVSKRQEIIKKGKDRSSQIEFKGAAPGAHAWTSESGAQMKDGYTGANSNRPQPANLTSAFEPARNPIHHGPTAVAPTSFEHPAGQAKRVSLDRLTQQQFVKEQRSGFGASSLQGILS